MVTDSVAATSNAGHHHIRKTSCLLKDLLTGLLADNALEVAHNGGERVWTDRRAD